MNMVNQPSIQGLPYHKGLHLMRCLDEHSTMCREANSTVTSGKVCIGSQQCSRHQLNLEP